jgi:hypothetical protein
VQVFANDLMRPRLNAFDCRDYPLLGEDFAQRLNAFFFGEHLTRRTWFAYGSGFTQLAPARTIYPGNYIVNYSGLKYVIPFGHLRLRMSGPTMGRLLQAALGARFATSNLPLLHRRTLESTHSAEFRPGVVAAFALNLAAQINMRRKC